MDELKSKCSEHESHPNTKNIDLKWILMASGYHFSNLVVMKMTYVFLHGLPNLKAAHFLFQEHRSTWDNSLKDSPNLSKQLNACWFHCMAVYSDFLH